MDFIPHHALLASRNTLIAPERWLLFLHGILGSGNNWRSFAQRLVDGHPEWGAVLVDLRMHGQSQAASPPHTLEAVANDLTRLEEVLPGPVRGVLGHSFGGKVALQYLGQRAERLSHAFILDSMPGSRPLLGATELTLKVLSVLRSVPLEVSTRAHFVESLQKKGIALGIAQWLATNLERSEEQYRFRLDLKAIDALMADYFARDLWPVYEQLNGETAVHVVLGGQSEVFTREDRARLAAIASCRSELKIHLLGSAGHWLHVDDPEGLYRLLDQALNERS